MFFQTKDKQDKQLSLYEQVTTLVTAVLHAECPEHRYHHHLLFTANARLQQYAMARDFYRPHIKPDTVLGTFSKDAYEVAIKKHNQLSIFIRTYMRLIGDPRPEHWQHYFRFSSHKIELLYTFYEQQQTHLQNLQLEQSFMEAFKQELIPLFHQID